MPIVRLMTASAILGGGLIAVATIGPRIALAQGTTAPTTAPKFAFVRGQDILAQTPGRQELEQRFQKEVDSARAQEKVWGDSINALLGDYANKEASLSADARTTRQAAIRQKQAEFQQKQQQLEQQVQQDNQRLVAPILQRVNGILDQVRNENNYTFIFDVQAQGGAIVAADKNLDITDQVVARLKAMGPVTEAGATATPAPKGPTTSPSGLGRPRNPQ